MMGSLLSKTLFDKRWFILGWSLALMAMVLLVTSFYPAFNDGAMFEDLAKSVPPQFKELIGDPEKFKSIPGYISQQLFDIRLPLLLMIMAILLGVGISVNEEEKGTMRTTLATPLSRVRIVLEKWLAAVIIMGLVALATIIGIYIGLFTINETMDAGLIWQLGLLSWLFGSSAVAIPLGLGLASGNRTVTMGLAIFATIGGFIISTFGKAVDWLEPYEKFSLMHYYDATKVAEGGIPANDLLVLSCVFFVILIVALVSFRHRDVY